MKINTSLRQLFRAGLLACLSLLYLPGYGQYAYFLQSGKIEYEKRVNMYAKIKERVERNKNNSWLEKIYEEYRRTQPQFVSSKSSLTFNADRAVYQFVEGGKPANSFFSDDPWLIAKNTVEFNFKNDTVRALKQVYDESYVVTGAKTDILWKLTNEVREIAGYQCRRANGLVRDSIYVVAFYAEQIVPSGGPESFSGLPGMILGVALPHENVTWFATSVETQAIVPPAPAPVPRKAKEVSPSAYEEELQKYMKDWGEWGADALKAFLF
jgi:GLPGLI family protein